MYRSKMSTSVTAASDILDKRWQKMTYDKHQKRLREVRGTIHQQNKLNFNHEEVQLQMRLRRAVAEERRQAIIDRENRKILDRLMYISLHQRTSLPPVSTTNTPRRDNKKKVKRERNKNQDEQKPSKSTVKLPPIETKPG